jgi:hypothetical protein
MMPEFPFDEPNPGNPYDRLAYQCGRKDFEFNNTSDRWRPAFNDLSTAVGRDVVELRKLLKDPSAPIWEDLRNKYGGVLAGAPISSDSLEGKVSLFMLASRVYDYLHHELRDKLECGLDEWYRTPVALADKRSVAQCACFFVNRARETDAWWDYFYKDQTIGEHKKFFFASLLSDVTAFSAALNLSQDLVACEGFRIVGKPRFGPERGGDGDDVDYGVRLDLRPEPQRFCVPSFLDAQGYDFFLPNGEVHPRQGRTVYVPWAGSSTPQNGIPEWVHSSVRLGECLVGMEVVGSVVWVGEPPCPADELLALLFARATGGDA